MQERRMFPIVLLAGLLILTGCFRQADNEFEPVILDGGQGVEPTPSALFFEVTPDSATPEGSPLPFLEISPPETETGPTEEPVVEFILPTEDLALTESAPDSGSETRADDNGNAPLIVTVAVSPTPPIPPTSSVPTVESQTGPQFITPGAPMNPNVIIITNTPEPEFTATSTPSGLITPTGIFEALEANCIYVVRGGDSLYRIAIVNNTTVAALRTANPQLVGDLIRPGQELRLPDCQPENPDAAPVVEVTAPPAPTDIIPTQPGGTTEYVVRAGDTLFNLATRFGVTVNQIVTLNNLANPNSLSIGQRLLIPSND